MTAYGQFLVAAVSRAQRAGVAPASGAANMEVPGRQGDKGFSAAVGRSVSPLVSSALRGGCLPGLGAALAAPNPLRYLAFTVACSISAAS